MTMNDPACPNATCPLLQGSLDQLLTREWLITNGRGGYASGTVIGAATRRYHGLLCAPLRPPLERYMLLAATLDRVTIDGAATEASTFEFNHAFHPAGFALQTDFAYSLAPPQPSVTFRYAWPAATLTKTIVLATGHDGVRIIYDVAATAPTARVRLDVQPFVCIRDYHSLRRQSAADPWEVEVSAAALILRDHAQPSVTLRLAATADSPVPARYEHAPAWWYNFRYREELARGFPGGEDLLCTGAFIVEGGGRLRVGVAAAAFGQSELPSATKTSATPIARQNSKSTPASRASNSNKKSRRESSAGLTDPAVVLQRLAPAAEQFVVARRSGDGPAGADANRNAKQSTILAGYHWFGDWGRDAFISLDGLLLAHERFDEARQVLMTFASAQRDGLIPNRFSDYGEECEYNSIDAALWYVHAADAYLTASGDTKSWSGGLRSACQNVVEAFVKGTRYDTRVDERGLVTCGDPSTQITWMDAKVGDYVCTPRDGRPVEINALWYHVLCILARRLTRSDPPAAKRYRGLADKAKAAFADAFWNSDEECLCDVVRDGSRDLAVRPNQIFAASLPNSMLTDAQATAVFEAVTRHLLTPVGLRSLSSRDSRYVGRYEGSPFDRDRAYHNGTVWPWLMGAYVDAHLRVNGDTRSTRAAGLKLLEPLVEHLDEAGLGTVSEIFDGDAPHTPRGCIAQAWSVAELIRAVRRLSP